MTQAIIDASPAADAAREADAASDAVVQTHTEPATATAPVAAAPVSTDAFAALGLTKALLKALSETGYSTPTPIQAQAIPVLLAGRDLLGLAETGTGKTAAFALPLLQLLSADGGAKREFRSCRALILAPTRELAIQIGESIETYGRHLTLTHTVIFGGVGARPQMRAMERGVDIVVATPGRLLDLISTRHINLDKVTHFVLDEADRMLDMGFIHDVRRVVKLLPKQRQSLLFSATMPDDIASLAADLLKSPQRIEIARAGKTVDRIEQRVHFVGEKEKRAALVALLQDQTLNRVIVFTRTKRGANRVAGALEVAGIPAEAIHGNKSQNARQAALANFRDGTARVLVATDIAARGIDIDDISHVINYELPNVPESYVHRIGRTARAGADGIAIALCAPDERAYLRDIERLTKKQLVDGGQIAGMAAFANLPEPKRKRDDEDAPAFERGTARIDQGRRNNRPYSAPRPDKPDGERRGGFGRDRDSERGGGERRPARADGERKPWSNRDGGDRRPPRADGERKPWSNRDGGDRKPWQNRDDGDRRPRGDGDRKPWSNRDRDGGERKPFGERKPWQNRDDGDRRPRGDGDRKPWSNRDGGERKPYAERKPWQNRDGGTAASDKPAQGSADAAAPAAFNPLDPNSRPVKAEARHGDRPQRAYGDRKPWQNRDGGDRGPRRDVGDRAPRRDGDRKPWNNRDGGDRKPWTNRDGGDRKPYGDREGGERKPWQNRDSAPRASRGDGERRPSSNRDGASRDGGERRSFGERKPWQNRDGGTGSGERKSWGNRDGAPRGDRAPRDGGARKPWSDRGERGSYQKRDGDPGPRRDGERKPWGNRDGGPRRDTRGGDAPRPRGPRPDAKPRTDGDSGNGSSGAA